MFHFYIGIAFLCVLLMPIAAVFLMMVKSLVQEMREAEYRMLQKNHSSYEVERTAKRLRLIK